MRESAWYLSVQLQRRLLRVQLRHGESLPGGESFNLSCRENKYVKE